MRKEYVRLLVITVINLGLAGVMLTIVGAAGLMEELYRDPQIAVFVGGGFSLFTLVVTLLLYRFVDKKPIRTLGFSFSLKDGLFTIAMSLLVILLYTVLIKGAELAGLAKVTYSDDYFSSGHYLLLIPFFFFWFTAALFEEVTNRAYFYANLRHLSIIKILIVSSLIFASWHIFKGLDPLYFIMLVTGGIAYMYIYWKSGNVWVGTIIHTVMNLLSSIFANEDPNARFSWIVVSDVKGITFYLLLVGVNIAIPVLLLIFTRMAYKTAGKQNEILSFPQKAES